jgi:hypothetical protein
LEASDVGIEGEGAVSEGEHRVVWVEARGVGRRDFDGVARDDSLSVDGGFSGDDNCERQRGASHAGR